MIKPLEVTNFTCELRANVNAIINLNSSNKINNRAMS